MTTATLTRPAAVAPRMTSAVLRYTDTGARCALGLLFFVGGLDGFLHLVPQPTEPMPEGAIAFGTALFQTGYLFPLIKGTELAAGALLLANRAVAFALVLLAPVVVNVFAFHYFLTPGSYGLATVIVVLQAYLAWTRRAAYRPLLSRTAATAQ
jgi:hypothetical protein